MRTRIDVSGFTCPTIVKLFQICRHDKRGSWMTTARLSRNLSKFTNQRENEGHIYCNTTAAWVQFKEQIHSEVQTVLYPAIYGGYLNERSEEKNHCAAGSLGRHCKPSPVGSRGETLEIFWLFCVLNSSKHCSLGSATRNVDKSLHQKSTLLSIWGVEFGIPNQYTTFKIALDMVLPNI